MLFAPTSWPAVCKSTTGPVHRLVLAKRRIGTGRIGLGVVANSSASASRKKSKSLRALKSWNGKTATDLPFAGEAEETLRYSAAVATSPTIRAAQAAITQGRRTR